MNDSVIPFFYCDFFNNHCLKSNQLYPKGYLRQRQVQWLLEKSDNYCNHWENEANIDLFGLTVGSGRLSSKQIKTFFNFIKKHLNEMRSDSMTRIGYNRDEYESHYLGLRKNISSFLALLKRRLFEICIQCKPIFKSDSLNELNDNSFCVLVIQQFKRLILFVDRLSKLKPELLRLAINSEPKTSIYNYFHCCLDIWWTAVEVMHIFDQNNEINLIEFSPLRQEMGINGLCLQTIRLVLFDLIVFSVNRFNDIKTSNRNYSLNLFDCLCVKEMYVSIRHVFKAVTNGSNDQFFGLMVSHLNLVSNPEPIEEQYQSLRDFNSIVCGNHSIEKPSLHYIWFVTNVIQTFKYSISGEEIDDQLTSNPIPISLMKKITLLLKQNDSEQSVSPLLLFCFNSVKLWKPTTDLLLPFVEFFLKNLNKRHSNISDEELAFIPENSRKWLQIISELSNKNRLNAFIDNSFCLFLSLLRQQLSLVFTSCDPKTKLMNWQKLKGKVVINVQPNKLEKLDEIGVFNLLTFYLVLLNANQDIWIDIIDTTLEMSSLLIEKRNNSKLMFKFMFTLLQIKPKSLSDEKICTFISNYYNKVCEQRNKNFRSDSLKKQFFDMTISYFEEMDLLLNSNQFSDISHNKLLNIKFNILSNLLISTEENQVVINFTSNLVNRINDFYELKEQDHNYNISSLVSICFNSFLPFIKNEISRKKTENILTEIAFSFTKLANNLNTKIQNKKFFDIFTDFLTIYRYKTEFQCKYLCKVLQDSSLLLRLKSEPSLSGSLLSTWSRYLVTPNIDESSLRTLTQRLSIIIEELKCDKSLVNSNTLEVFTIFVKNLMKKYVECDQNGRTSIIQRVRRYLNDMITTSEEVIRSKNFSLISIKKILYFMSILVSIGSQLVYIPLSADCLLVKIIDFIVVPTNMSNDIKQQLMPIFNKFFPSFIEGLFKLEYDGNLFLERQIRKIISLYLPLYVNQSNPFIKLKTTLEKKNVYNHWIKLFFQTIVKNFFNRNESLPMPPVIKFIEESAKSDLSEEQLIAILEFCLNKVLLVDIRSKDNLLSLIRAIVIRFNGKQSQQVLIDKVFTEFIESNLLNKSGLKRFFEVINFICRSSPALFHGFVGQINRSIETIEKKRNIGTDFILRNALREFANQKRF